MKRLLQIFTIVFAGFSCEVLLAQKMIVPPVENIEWWRTPAGCGNEAKNPESKRIGYVPRTTSSKPVPKDLFRGKLGKDICVRTTLPELETQGITEGWVWQMKGTEAWHRLNSEGVPVPVMMMGCLNDYLEWFEIPETLVTVIEGPRGPQGETGARGEKGETGGQGIQGIPGPPAEPISYGPPPLAVLPPEKKSHKKLIGGFVGTGIAIGLGLYLKSSNGGNGSSQKNSACSAGSDCSIGARRP